MDNKAWITITGTQRADDGSEDRLDYATEGLFYERNGCFYVIYEESQASGLAGVKTSLKAEKERVVINRLGKVNHKQEFAVNEYHQSSYVTPYGTILMGIRTEALECDLTAQGGHISLKYNLFVEEQPVSYHTLSITVNRIHSKEELPREHL